MGCRSVVGLGGQAPAAARRAAITPPSMSRSLPVMKPASGPSRKGSGRRDLVGRADAPGGGGLDHLLVVGGAGAGHLVAGQRGDDDAGADGVDARAALTPSQAFSLDAQVV